MLAFLVGGGEFRLEGRSRRSASCGRRRSIVTLSGFSNGFPEVGADLTDILKCNWDALNDDDDEEQEEEKVEVMEEREKKKLSQAEIRQQARARLTKKGLRRGPTVSGKEKPNKDEIFADDPTTADTSMYSEVAAGHDPVVEPEEADEAEVAVAEGSEQLVVESGLLFATDGEPEWYFLQARAGMEDRVRASIEGMVRNIPHISSKIADVIVPKLQVMKLTSAGKTVKKDDLMFPGYLLIYMIMDFPTWREVNNVAYVHGFVGDTNQKDFKGPFQKPLPVAPTEIKQIFQRLHQHSDVGKEVVSEYLPGQRVYITEGPFANHEGRVAKVVPEQELATVSVLALNRITEAEVLFSQMKIAEPKAEGEDEDELDEIFGKVGTQSEVNLKKMKRRNRDMKKGDTVVVTRGSYGGCTGEVKMTLPKQGKVLVSLKMFSRSLDVKLDVDIVRLESDSEASDKSEEDDASAFVAAETIEDQEDGESVAKIDRESGEEEEEEDEGLETLLRDLSSREDGQVEDLSDEDFLRKIGDSFSEKKEAVKQKRRRRKDEVGVDSVKSWLDEPQAEGDEAETTVDEFGTKLDDLVSLVGRRSSKSELDSDFQEDEIVDEDDDMLPDFDVEMDDSDEYEDESAIVGKGKDMTIGFTEFEEKDVTEDEFSLEDEDDDDMDFAFDEDEDENDEDILGEDDEDEDGCDLLDAALDDYEDLLEEEDGIDEYDFDLDDNLEDDLNGEKNEKDWFGAEDDRELIRATKELDIKASKTTKAKVPTKKVTKATQTVGKSSTDWLYFDEDGEDDFLTDGSATSSKEAKSAKENTPDDFL